MAVECKNMLMPHLSAVTLMVLNGLQVSQAGKDMRALKGMELWEGSPGIIQPITHHVLILQAANARLHLKHPSQKSRPQQLSSSV